MSQHLHDKMSKETSAIGNFTLMEVGVGFIKYNLSNYLECICFNVIGEYQKVVQFISQLRADVIVLEIESANPDKQISRLGTLCSEVLRWYESGEKEGADRKAKLVWGSETKVVERISKFVCSVFTNSQSSQGGRHRLSEVCSMHFQQGCPHAEATIEMQNGLGEALAASDFKEMRKQLKLQESFTCAPEELLPELRNKEYSNKEEPESQLRVRRQTLVKEVIDIPLMKLFYNILNQENREIRMTAIMVLARGLYKKTSEVLKDTSLKVDHLFKQFERSGSKSSCREYYEAKNGYEKKHVGLENLWRELCIIYQADCVNQAKIPRLAAQHLLDGFPLEIIDGDAGRFSKSWVDNVLQELQTMASKSRRKPARILVMSVIGLQSSGKSTLLNLMFGTQLQTSAGRCTRGVYVQLVPSRREEYDYVLLLDIEGLRSPEFFPGDSNSSIIRDNALATFGLLPSDVSVFMVSNEDDLGLREILPMVLLAFKGSEIAEEYGQRIRSKIVFVYRSVDTNDQEKIKVSKQKLSRYLMDAAREVDRVQGRLDCAREDAVLSSHRPGQGHNQPESSSEDLQVDLKLDFQFNDRHNDVKFFGNLKRGSNPPADTPEWDYGENILRLREYLHKRVVDDMFNNVPWEGSTFEEWGKHLTMVWDCILTSDFEISFRNKLQYVSYLELLEKIRQARTKVSSAYVEAFESFEQEVMMSHENASHIYDNSSARSIQLINHVRCQTLEVEKLFDANKSYSEWKSSELEQWDHFCSSTEHWYEKRIDDLVNGEVRFKRVIEKYQLKCKEEIVKKYEEGIWGAGQIDSAQMQRRFAMFFEDVVKRAEREYPPISASIREQIGECYKRHHLADVPSDKWPFNLNWMLDSGSKADYPQKGGSRLRQKLDFMIHDELKFERQYSPLAVDRIIDRAK
ncbi:hypothetical protein KP509_22G012000 [Ceratopteris richardii]|uniref:VLIG-type G domain-containing protein n=1 Tax=Ceratopteris richardii TaxID=49495 RepID=A0A8T2S5Y5_CERRI|nr:hypothetical protein KP509_22G012000 [Ceratopteris richardii]